MRDNVEVIESLWDAFGRGDLDRVAAGVAEDGEIVFPPTVPWGGSYRGPDGLRQLLDELLSRFAEFKAKPEMILGADDEHVVVVVNASDDGTVEAVRDLAPAATVIETGANLGFGSACNRGAAASTGELIL